MNTKMEDYDLELDRAVSEIRKSRAKRVCIQLPDGLKPKADKIADYIQEKTKAEVMIWIGTCFGACDIPDLSNTDSDLLIQWGHSKWQQ
ncbi:MAG: diphthamide synthesis protein [Candidatus Woesearchaeota archaeon]|nr:diphthamide synthesis protein [Candidatus Woesearchaeota archaeon]